MYGPRRMNFRQQQMQANTPAGTPLGSTGTPMEGQEPGGGGGYFDFGPARPPQQWPPQPQQAPLDPVEEMERDLMNYDPQFPVEVPVPIESQMDSQINSQMDPQMDPQMNSRMNPQMDPQMDPQMGPQMNPQINPQMNPQMDPQMDSQMDPQMDSQMDPQMDPQMGLNQMQMRARLSPQIPGHMMPIQHQREMGMTRADRLRQNVNSMMQQRQSRQQHPLANNYNAMHLNGLENNEPLENHHHQQQQQPMGNSPMGNSPMGNSQMGNSQMGAHHHLNTQQMSAQLGHIGGLNGQLGPSGPVGGPVGGSVGPVGGSVGPVGGGSSVLENTSTLTRPAQLRSVSSPQIIRHSPLPMIVDGPKPMHELKLEELMKSRRRYKARSSIPPDLSSANYAAQCIAAAESSRLSPYHLALGEYSHLRTKLPHMHVTTYLNIRNGILRLWLANPLVAVTLVEAAGCCKDARYYLLAEFAFEWLVRNGYINQGCCTHQGRYSSSIAGLPKFSNHRRKPRQTIAVIGAGVAGLSCARQLESLLERYSTQILTYYEDLPRVVVLEGRKRIGGRVYSPMLSSERMSVDIGGDTIMGFGGGNPLGVVMRRQLGIPVVSIDTTGDENILYDGDTGEPISAQVDYRAHEMFKYLLERMRNFEMGLGTMNTPPNNAPGVKSLIRAGQDPQVVDSNDEHVTIAQYEEELERPYTIPPSESSDDGEHGQEVKVELDFLKSLGFETHAKSKSDKDIRVHAEPASQGASLGLTMTKLVEHLGTLTDLNEQDRRALDWYMAKFEYTIGDNLDNACLSSWSHYRSNRFTGRHAWARDGMSTFIKGLDTVPNKLDVRFKTVVNVVEYEEDSAQLTLENGEQVLADRVVVTTPLGCLKRRSMQFIPDLPQWKLDSIDRLEYGVVNKVVLVFDEPFWDSSTPSIIRVTAGSDKDSRGQCFVFQNHSRRRELGGKALIVGLVSGCAARKITENPDYEIIEPAVEKLRKVFKKHPHAQSAKLVESIVTRWQVDRFSRGSFSHVGVDGTVTDHDLLARPVLRSLFFAGEATSRMYPGSIHGAYISGLRAAKEVLNSLVGGIEVPDELILDHEWSFDDESTSSNDNHPHHAHHQVGAAHHHLHGGHLHTHPHHHHHHLQHQHQNNSKDELIEGAAAGSARANSVAHDMRSTGAGASYDNPSFGMESPLRNGSVPTVPTAANYAAAAAAAGGQLDGSASSANAAAAAAAVAAAVSADGKRHLASPETVPFEPVDYSKAEAELLELRKRRKTLEREQLERDMMHEIGQRPEKPERHGTTNPFLLFQKDYWDICRQETEAAKQKDKKTGQIHASRNEIRASLGKKWRSLPDDERAPYVERSHQAKIENEERQEAFLRKLKWYESEAANFRQQWVQEHPSTPSLRERQLEEQLEGYRPRKKRSRLTE